jgi:hypothetical protein
MKLQLATLWLVLLASACSSSSGADGPVLTADAAIVQAKIYWRGVYEKTRSETFSDASVNRFEPYTAVLADGVWTVRGTIPSDFHGIVPEASVQQSDGFTRVHGVQR